MTRKLHAARRPMRFAEPPCHPVILSAPFAVRVRRTMGRTRALGGIPASDRALRRPASQIALMPDPRYTDDERALILRRAAELQQRQGEAVHALSELERAAAAAGIDPLLVRRVARELAPGAGAEPDTRHDAAGDARVVVRRRVDDARTPLASSAVLGAIRRHSPVLGEVRGLGDGFEWRYDTR
jgi:hypothetical protein